MDERRKEIKHLIVQYYKPVPYITYVGYNLYINEAYAIMVSTDKKAIVSNFDYVITILPNTRLKSIHQLHEEHIESMTINYTVEELMIDYEAMYQEYRNILRPIQKLANGKLKDPERKKLIRNFIESLKHKLKDGKIE